MPRWLLAALVALTVLATSGLPAAIAGVVGCGESCEEEHADSDEDCPDESGCPPLCSFCVCASYAAPAITQVDAVAALRAAPVLALAIADREPPSPLLPGVFHPPRSA